MSTTLQVGTKAPDFTLTNQSGKPVSLRDRIGEKVVVLYFYPKDFTSGCTTEACGFRDSYETFHDAGAEVIGVSADSADSHQAFAQKYQLPFTLLSDPESRVAQVYGLGKVFGLFTKRVTFVIDRQGIIRHVFESQINMDAHVRAALKIVQELQQART